MIKIQELKALTYDLPIFPKPQRFGQVVSPHPGDAIPDQLAYVPKDLLRQLDITFLAFIDQGGLQLGHYIPHRLHWKDKIIGRQAQNTVQVQAVILVLKDLESVSKKIGAAERQANSGDKDAKLAFEVYTKIKNHLDSGKPTRLMNLTEAEARVASELFLLTSKPVLFICNVSESEVHTENAHVKKVREIAEQENARVVVISGKIESEIVELPKDERTDFLDSLGLKEPGLHSLIRETYTLLDLISFLTAGPEEVRAWTIPRGTKNPQAAGTIHSDFERGFICADVIWWEDFIKLGSEAACKEKGLVRTEGRDYIVKDGDVMHFKFNV